MSNNNIVTIQLLGRNYQLKCLGTEAARLEAAAIYLDSKMQAINSNSVGFEKTAVLAGLDICCELLRTRDETSQQIQAMDQRLEGLFNKIEEAVQQSQSISPEKPPGKPFGEQQQLELQRPPLNTCDGDK